MRGAVSQVCMLGPCIFRHVHPFAFEGWGVTADCLFAWHAHRISYGEKPIQLNEPTSTPIGQDAGRGLAVWGLIILEQSCASCFLGE